MEILVKIVQVIVSLGLLIILHEGGHFLFAKLFGARIEKFYLFFDYKFHLASTYDKWFRRWRKKPEIKKDENGNNEYDGTEYGIGWIPLGGYVKISGMIDESMDTEQMKKDPQPWEFRTKPAWQRLLIMLGGVLMNFIAAFLIYAMVLFVWGKDYVKNEDLTYGMKFNETAKAMGFQDGDVILSIDDETFEYWDVNNMRAFEDGKQAVVLRTDSTGKQQKVNVKLPGEMSLLDMFEEPRFADLRMPIEVDSIVQKTEAARIKLKKGNTITHIKSDSIKGKGIDRDVTDYNDFLVAVNDLAKKLDDSSSHSDSISVRTVALTIKDGDSLRVDTVTLDADFKLGFVNKNPYENKVTHQDYGFFESFPAGASYGWTKLSNYVGDLKYIFTKKGAKSVGGFITIGKIFPGQWDWQSFWLMTALLSIMLGVVNVLPIPALDGGHALFCIYEMITGKKPSDKFMERAQIVGLVLLFGLLIFANLNDILKLFGVM